MDDKQRSQRDRLIIFSRYPVPGQTKTRLIPALGRVGAADLQRELTEKALKTARRFGSGKDVELEVRFEGVSEHKMRRWLGSAALFSNQGPGDLGERMRVAFLEAFQKGCRRVVLLGTDIPGISTNLLEKAFDGLIDKDLVVGPSRDGGYYLLGLKGPAKIFQNVPWGTGEVLEKTLALAKDQGLSVLHLDPLIDIDTEEDLKQSLPGWNGPGPYVSVIIPALNEAENIETTIRHAQDAEAEVIVVDGGSTDRTVETATRTGVHVLTSTRGRAWQQNCGASAAQGKVLLFLHADTRLPRDYISQAFDTLMDPRIALGAFRFKTDLNRFYMKVTELFTNARSRYLKLPYGDQALFLKKSLFQAIGGFPEVSIAEDLLLVRRLAKQGRIGIAPAEVITSARRWRTMGMLRTFLTNQVIVIGLVLGVSSHVLASLYRHSKKK
ncbi:MAG: TIGR04283 family arsenosugar biosynthesis glycosyltransferase [Desulfobacteraceae bacterium]|jgi:rSAM/selenodomain-associated transferase 2/rSAM/selenodomain-associated transferase 1